MTRILAHRGASVERPENTLAAFRRARDLGADGVELDVRRTADGVLVVHHDAALPDGRLVAAVTRAGLPPDVPSLAEALEECEGLVVDVEVKNLPVEPDFDEDEGVALAVAELVDRPGTRDRVVVASFWLPSIDAVQATGRGLTTGWLTTEVYDQLAALALVVERGHAALQPRHEAVTPELVAAVHGRGRELHAWTVDDPDRVRQLAAMGVDTVMTNVPGVARAALVAG